jgi:Leucine rich repeat/Trypsin
MKLVSNCSENKNVAKIISSRTFCAVGEDQSAPCRGDGGSGFYKTLNSKRYVKGVVSAGVIKYNFKCDPESPTVFTSVENYSSWLLQIIDDERFLNCKFTEFRNFWCSARRLTIESDDYHIAGVKGKLNSSASSRYVEKFVIEDQQTKFLPVNLGKIFPILVLYKVKSSSLTAIRNCDFTDLNSLTHLSVTGNFLGNLTDDVFVGLSKLQNLNLENNTIQSLPYEIFSSNIHLKMVRLSHNRIVYLDFPLFQHNVNLQSIAFDNNKLDRIHQNFTLVLKKLTRADFRNNTCINDFAGDFRTDGEDVPIELELLRDCFIEECEG